MTSRNTRTARICPTCKGAGSFTVNNTNPYGFGPDPQCDEDVPCRDCMDGWIRWAPDDALVRLSQERRGLMLLRNSPFRSMARNQYAKVRAAAMRPVELRA